MTITEGKKKRPSTFHYLPKSRATRLRKAWIEDHKIRSKWKAQKKREGLARQTGVPVEDTPNHLCNETNTDFESDKSPNLPDKSSMSPHDKPSLRDLRKTAYASKPLSTPKKDLTRSEGTRGHPHGNSGWKTSAGRETGQPNMKLRMNVLLEKIKRDLS